MNMPPGMINPTEASDYLSSLVGSAPFGILAFDSKGEIAVFNDLALEYLELDEGPEKRTGMQVLEITDHVPDLHGAIKRCMEEGKSSFNLEALWINETCLSIKCRSILKGYLVTFENITRIKAIETNSIQSILEGQEKERRRIGREIHDSVGSLLSSVRLSLDAFMDDLSQAGEPVPTRKIEEAISMLDSMAVELRNMSHQLMPRILEEYGLSLAFANMVRNLGKLKKQDVKFYCNFENEPRFDKEIELNLYRCGEELVNNALKYAEAGEIMVQLIKHEHSLLLMVEDNGKGFVKEKLSQDHFGIGLTNIDTRVRLLGGEFILDSHEGEGTTATIELFTEKWES